MNLEDTPVNAAFKMVYLLNDIKEYNKQMMSPVLPIVSVSMAESLKKLGFSDVTPFCYNDGERCARQLNARHTIRLLKPG